MKQDDSHKKQYGKKQLQQTIRQILENQQDNKLYKLYIIYEDGIFKLTNHTIEKIRIIEKALPKDCSVDDMIENIDIYIKIAHYVQDSIQNNDALNDKLEEYANSIIGEYCNVKYYKDLFLFICGIKIYELYINDFNMNDTSTIQHIQQKYDIVYHIYLKDNNNHKTEITMNIPKKIGDVIELNGIKYTVINVQQFVKEDDLYMADIITIDNTNQKINAYDLEKIVQDNDVQSAINIIKLNYNTIRTESQYITPTHYKEICAKKVLVNHHENNQIIVMLNPSKSINQPNIKSDDYKQEIYESLIQKISNIVINLYDDSDIDD